MWFSPWLVTVVLPLIFLGALTREQIGVAGSTEKWRNSGGLIDLGLQMGVTGFMMQIGSVLKNPTATLVFSVLLLLGFAFGPLYYFRSRNAEGSVVSGFILLVVGFAWLTIWLV